jgi:uncharacterized membrane protein
VTPDMDWPAPTGRGTVWMRAALGASLALNLVLGAVALGFVGAPAAPPAALPRAGAEPRRGFERMLARLEAALPEPDRPAFRQVIDAERPRYEPPLQALRAARRAVDEALARDPFDPAALRAAMQDWSARSVAFNAAFTDTLVHAMDAVSPQGRARIAEARDRTR